MTKRSRPIAFAMLLACVLLPAGSVPHDHDEGEANVGHHHCVICCLTYHAAMASAVATPTSGTDDAVLAAFGTRSGIRPFVTLGIQPTRGPPV